MRARFFLFLLFIPAVIFSQEVTVELSSNKNEVAISEEFIITLVINSNTDNLYIEKYPELDQAVSINSIGQSKSYNMMATVHGIEKNVTLNFEYLCRINKVGTFNIGPFIISSKGKKYNSNILTINVVEKRNQDSLKRLETQAGESDKNKFYILKVEPTKTTIYENEFFDINVNLYSYRGYDFRIRDIKKINYPSNAWVENTLLKEENFPKRVIINNEFYDVYTLEKERIYIPRAGEYEIDPFEVVFDGIVSRDFFALPESIHLKSRSLKIAVKPLPERVKDKNFKGAVGNFILKSELSPLHLNVNEATTFLITLEGEGNFHNIDQIDYYIDKGLEVYSSKSNIYTNNNIYKTKKWEIILVPTKSGTYQVKLNDFVYFSEQEKKYKIIKGEKFTLTVKGEVAQKIDEFFNKPENSTQSKNIQSYFSDISFIKLNKGRKKSNYHLITLYLQIFFYLVMLLSIVTFSLYKYSLSVFEKNRGLNREKLAYKNFLKSLNKIFLKDLKDENVKILDKISESLEKYFTEKFNLPTIEFTKKTIDGVLKGILNEDQLKIFHNCMLELNMARFGEKSLTIEEIKRLIEEIKEIIKRIDEAKR